MFGKKEKNAIRDIRIMSIEELGVYQNLNYTLIENLKKQGEVKSMIMELAREETEIRSAMNNLLTKAK